MNASEFHRWLESSSRPLVMGILNVTPDSFSDGGRFANVDAAISQAQRMVAEGADLLDIGGESTRPGSMRVPAEEQLQRVIPVIEAIRRRFDVAISVDTTLSEVAKAAGEAGADILNDISAGREDAGMLHLAAERGWPLILMHMQGEPGTMQKNPTYGDVVSEVAEFLAQRAGAAVAAGCRRERVIVDPGLGFGKTMAHNLLLLRELERIGALGYRVLVGASRKRFVGEITGASEPADRVIGSCVSAAWAVWKGASIVRVHDVAQSVQALRMAGALLGIEGM